MSAVSTRSVRIAVQFCAFALWVALILSTRHPIDSGIAKILPVSLFLRLDPLVMTVVSGAMRVGVTITLLAAVTVGVSILLGRVFCGWVCPLGAIFDAWGWFLTRFRVRIFGPSPPWYRFKFYLLLALLVFAILGGVSPLMGLDPIVLLTRTAATVLYPLFRKANDLHFQTGAAPGFHGNLVNGATLVLFLTIMAATTRVSRIWCRTVCPLGAYLGTFSRHSVLRRQTQNCVHCMICVNQCPTGAIDFKNPEVYNESECIKCFTCSDECPVDANFFGLRNPLPAVQPDYHPVSLERRQILATAAVAVTAMPALQLSSGEAGENKTLIRPPMSREEKDFLTSCIRCGECMKACPTGVLKPAGLEHGIRALWTPVMEPTEGYCQKGCNACSQACPTDAILKYPIEKKYTYKAGTAVFNSALCIGYTENKFCNECIKICPVEAISFEKGWEPEGGFSAGSSDSPAPAGQKATRPLHVAYDRCVGCGACEYACNQIVMGSPAMVTTAFGRATATNSASQSS